MSKSTGRVLGRENGELLECADHKQFSIIQETLPQKVNIYSAPTYSKYCGELR